MAPVLPAAALELAGSSVHLVNIVSVAVVGGIVSIVSFAYILDVVQHKFRAQSKEGHASRWGLFALLVCSYGLLVPGLFATLFSYNVSVSILGFTKALKMDTESMIQLIGTLYNKGLVLAGSLVMLYAMIIPGMKIVLLIMGEFWRCSASATRVRWAARCISTVQLISKWACPDLFAYILMTYLFRSLSHPPNLLAVMNLDVGFACFGVFCVGSTLASLGIRMPETAKTGQECETSSGNNSFRGRFVAAIVVALALAFCVLLSVGLVTPCMDLHMDLQLLYENKPDMKPFAPFLEEFHIQELLHAEVSIWNCMVSLARSIGGGEMVCVIALAMFAVFVVAVTVLDMFVLVWSALLRSCGDATGARSYTMFTIAQKLKKLSMLDVLIMGVVVVVVSLKSMRAKGVIISIQWGLLWLLGAEICHYAVFYLVGRIVADSSVTQKAAPNTQIDISV